MNDDGELRLRASGVRQVYSLLSLGQLERAQEIAIQTIAAAPGRADGHLSLAHVLEEKDHLPEALAATERALAIEPDSDPAHGLRARILRLLGRFAEAEQSYLRAMELDPGDSDYYANYAILLSVCDRDTEALTYAERALSLEPDSAELHRLRASLLLHVAPSKWQISEDAVHRALRLAPYDAQNHAILGMVRLRARDYQGAEDAFREALRLSPHNPLALAGLSELVKGRYWWYRPLLEFGAFMSRLSQDGRLGVIFALWAVYVGLRSVIPDDYSDVSDGIRLLYFGFCAYTWVAEPITLALLRRVYPWLE